MTESTAPSPGASIRPARPEDSEAIRQVHAAGVETLGEERYPAEAKRAWAGRILAETKAPSDRGTLVAESGGRVVGFARLDADNAEIAAVYLDEKLRGLGIGRALVEAIEQVAREQGLERLGLASTIDAAGFYERLGFERGEVHRHAVAPGFDAPCVRMKKTLAPAD